MKHAEAKIRRSAIIWDAINGLSGNEIAEKHSMPVNTVRAYCAAGGVSIKRQDVYYGDADKYWNKYAPMMAYYFEGNTLDNTGKKFGNVCRERVRQIINECGFTPRSTTPIPSETLTKDRFNRLTFREKLWSQVNIKDKDECWDWTGEGTTNGYGRAYFPHRRQGKGKAYNVYAHRLAYIITNRRYPKLFILHSCDNRACCNPAHLREGTQAENVSDRMTRGYEAWENAKNIGIENAIQARGQLKLTPDVAIQAVELLKTTPQRQVKAQMHLSSGTLSRLYHGTHWLQQEGLVSRLDRKTA